ncbi:hypothetical protein GCM10023349_34630 [Nocardioides conyzicola]|uniref:Uncharacterized protein n=1 Tax=Nocardioides conyzicola TaxID=1651781 RepID=A0ABP8XSL8_9ACTN
MAATFRSVVTHTFVSPLLGVQTARPDCNGLITVPRTERRELVDDFGRDDPLTTCARSDIGQMDPPETTHRDRAAVVCTGAGDRAGSVPDVTLPRPRRTPSRRTKVPRTPPSVWRASRAPARSDNEDLVDQWI